MESLYDRDLWNVCRSNLGEMRSSKCYQHVSNLEKSHVFDLNLIRQVKLSDV